MSENRKPAALILADGTVYRGVNFGTAGTVFGEIVFTTGVSGFQETLTDPSNFGQIVVQTFPSVGGYGVNNDDYASDRCHLSGYVVRNVTKLPSNYKMTESLGQFTTEQGVVGIEGVDPRAITRHVRPVTEKTLDIEMVHQTRMHATYRPTQEPAKRGCRALLDFAGYMDGKEIPDSRMEKVMVVLGDGKLMPAAEQAIYGHRAGETFRFDFTYPAEFRVPELSGKTAQFEINLRSVAEKHTPELTEEFAKSIGYDSLAAMRESIRAQKQKIHEEGADRAAGQRLLEMAGANIEVHIAPETLDRTADNEMKLLGERLSRSGLTVEQHCKNSHTTPEALRQRYRDEAESRARVMLAARAIAEAEQIVVHPEEVNAEYRRLAALQETPEAEIRKVLTEDAVAAALAAKKVQRFLLDHAEVTSVTDSAEKE